MSRDEPRFSDEEVREILEEAAAHSPSLPVPTAEGLSLEELTSVAAEAGIDPARVVEAARRRLDRRRPDRPDGFSRSLVGLPRFLAAERRVAGDIAEAHHADLLGAIRTGLGQLGGEATETSGALEWTGDSEMIGRHVELSSRDGVTTIRASTDLSIAALSATVPTGVIGTGLTIAAMIGYADTGLLRFLALALVILPTIYTIVRFILGRVADAESERVHATVDELARLVSEETD